MQNLPGIELSLPLEKSYLLRKNTKGLVHIMHLKNLLQHCSLPRYSTPHSQTFLWMHVYLVSIQMLSSMSIFQCNSSRESIMPKIGETGIVAKRAQQVRSANKSFDERFKALMDFKHKFGHCNVTRRRSGGYKSLRKWCNHLRMSLWRSKRERHHLQTNRGEYSATRGCRFQMEPV